MIGKALVAGLGLVPLFSSESKAVRIRRGYAISCYAGANGHFKSYSAAMDTAPTLRGIPWHCTNPDHLHTATGQTSGLRRVLSTMRFTLPDGRDHPLWDPLDDMAKILHAEHCDLILDEVAGAAGSTSGADDVPAPVKARLQELRRVDVMCRHTAPAWNRATKVLRECTQAVNLCMGYYPSAHGTMIGFDGPHALPAVDTERGEIIEGVCELPGEHEHDSGRQWASRRLGFIRTYDATIFDEWTAAKRAKIRPEVRQVFWRPGHHTESSYDTFAHVYKLGHITDGGTCLDCGGKRPRQRSCACEQDNERRKAVRDRAAR